MDRWIGLPSIAMAAGTSRTAIAKAVRRSLVRPEYKWRGSRLIVAITHGRGGSSGSQYKVQFASLPKVIRSRIDATAGEIDRAKIVPLISRTQKIAVLEAVLRDLRREVD